MKNLKNHKILVFAYFVLLIAALCFPALAQNYPSSLDTESTLTSFEDFKSTYLTVGLNSLATAATVASTSNWTFTTYIVQIGNEQLKATKTGPTSITLVRAVNGTTAASHPSGTAVKIVWSSFSWNPLRTANINLQTKLGIGASDAATAPAGTALCKTAAGTSWNLPINCSQGSYALEFYTPNHSNVTHGVMYLPNVTYTKFMYEALAKPLGQDYFWIVGKGGAHNMAISFSTGPNGGYAISGHYDNFCGTPATVNFTTNDEIPYDTWAHVALIFDGSYATVSIDGIPSYAVATSQNRCETLSEDGVAYTGGSDHNNGQFRIAAERIWETDLPLNGVYSQVFRPAVAEIGAGIAYNRVTNVRVKAYMVMDYRDGTLKDSSGNAFNGFMSDTAPYNPLNLFNGNFASNGTYGGDPNSDAPPDPTHLPQWKVDPFAYPATTGCSASSHPAPATPPVGAVRYDSFGRCDVHYGNHILPLTLGNLEVGGVSWTANNFGIYNGNAFVTDLAYGRAEDGVVPANFDAGKTDYTTTISRPVAFDSAFGGTYTIYFRYTDLNNWARLAVDEGSFGSAQIMQRVGGGAVTVPAGCSITNFGNTWQSMSIVTSGTTVTAKKGSTTMGTCTINAGLTGTKVGFGLSNSFFRLADIAVF
jgi:hypothetical protein